MLTGTSPDGLVPAAFYQRLATDLRATPIARHSRVDSSTPSSIRTLHPSRVRTSARSYAHTWFGRSGRSRTHDPSFSHTRPRFGEAGQGSANEGGAMPDEGAVQAP